MAPDPAPRWLRNLVLLGVVLGAASLLPAATTAALHCDETNVFRHVTRFQHGNFTFPGRPGLLWLALVPLNLLPDPTTTVTAYRLMSVLASVFTLAAVAGLALRPRGDESAPTRAGAWGALAALMLLATSAGWQTHAFEIRTDTYVVPLTLAAIALLFRPDPRRQHLILAGIFIAASGLVSQKSVFNAVAIGVGWALYLSTTARPLDPVRRLKDVAVFGGVAAVLMGAWFAVLGLLAGDVEHAATTTVKTGMNTALRTGVSMADKVEVLGRSFDKGAILWVVAALSVPVAALLFRRIPRSLSYGLIALLMVGTIYVHSGFRVYYVASFEPYMALAAAGPLGLLAAELHRRVHPALPVVLLLVLGFFATDHSKPFKRQILKTDNALATGVLEDVAELFPDPVPYWDGLALVPGYPETTFLNTGSTRHKQRRRHGKNAYIKLARERKPQFFVRTYMSRDQYMRPDERKWHWTHFLPLRDNLYGAGGRIKARKGKTTKGQVEILTPGKYRVWFLGKWKGQGKVDGQRVKHGQVLDLTEGKHQLEARITKGGGELWLILGTDRKPLLKRSQQQIDWSFFALDWRSRYGQYDKAKGRADLLTPRNDPTMNDARFKTRKKRHRAWQKARYERTGSP